MIYIMIFINKLKNKFIKKKLDYYKTITEKYYYEFK